MSHAQKLTSLLLAFTLGYACASETSHDLGAPGDSHASACPAPSSAARPQGPPHNAINNDAMPPDLFYKSFFPETHNQLRPDIDISGNTPNIRAESLALPPELICALSDYVDPQSYLKLMRVSTGFNTMLRDNYPRRFAKFVDSLFHHPYLGPENHAASDLLNTPHLYCRQYDYTSAAEESSLGGPIFCLEFYYLGKDCVRFCCGSQDADRLQQALALAQRIVPCRENHPRQEAAQNAFREIHPLFILSIKKMLKPYFRVGSTAAFFMRSFGHKKNVQQLCNSQTAFGQLLMAALAPNSGDFNFEGLQSNSSLSEAACQDRVWQYLFAIEREVECSLGCSAATRAMNYVLLDWFFIDFMQSDFTVSQLRDLARRLLTETLQQGRASMMQFIQLLTGDSTIEALFQCGSEHSEQHESGQCSFEAELGGLPRIDMTWLEAQAAGAYDRFASRESDPQGPSPSASRPTTSHASASGSATMPLAPSQILFRGYHNRRAP